MSLVYLAGPVDDVDAITANYWRSEVAKHVTSWSEGHVCYDPQRPWLVAASGLPANARYIDLVNREVIRVAVAVIANLAGPGRGIGTIREIEFARSIDRPVLVFVPDDLPPTVALHDLLVVRMTGSWADTEWVYGAVSGFLELYL